MISGFRVSWDSRHPPGQRVLGVWLQEEEADHVSNASVESGVSTPALKDGEAISRDDTKPVYKVLTREYMAQGYDGFTPLKGNKYLIDDESGQITSTVVRKYLLGRSLISRAHQPGMLTYCDRVTIHQEASQSQRVSGSSARRNPWNHSKGAFSSEEKGQLKSGRRELAESCVVCHTRLKISKALP